MIRIGNGLDIHGFVPDRQLILGGVVIPHPMGLAGHSDADALSHAICDSLLGALSLGDIGHHFPDSDDQWKDASGMLLLKETAQKIQAQKARIINVDTTVALQTPRLSLHVPQMTANIADALSVHSNQISIKATTTESLGFIGRKEGIAVFAVALLEVQD